MAGKAQIGGMLLEEAILRLLGGCGYKPVGSPIGDPTLKKGSAGIEVKGRGCDHQIDAIADFLIHQPFSNPQRLLVEAKCTGGTVGVQVVRNAFGVLRDVSEFWVPGDNGGEEADRSNRSSRSRYHYQYAVFSSTQFSAPAQDYAFAQDIYLLPLRGNDFFRPVIRAIDDLAEEKADRLEEPLGDYRQRVRSWLDRQDNDGVSDVVGLPGET